MDTEDLQLVAPDESLREAFWDMLREYRLAESDQFQDVDAEARAEFPALVRRLRDAGEGKLRPEGYREQTWWLVRDGRRIVGTIRLRLDMPRYLRREQGDIGYDVRPSERGRHYATFMLRKVLDVARGEGLTRVMLVCAKDNLASAKVIRNNGGKLDSEFLYGGRGPLLQRYWIEL